MHLTEIKEIQFSNKGGHFLIIYLILHIEDKNVFSIYAEIILFVYLCTLLTEKF